MKNSTKIILFVNAMSLIGYFVNLALYVYFSASIYLDHLVFEYNLLLLGEWACLALVFITFALIVVSLIFERKHEKEDK